MRLIVRPTPARSLTGLGLDFKVLYNLGMTNKRCAWVKAEDELYEEYHDKEWGVPTYDDAKIFEFLVLESAQAGLSWRTILGRRAGYRRAFADFDPQSVAAFSAKDVERLMTDENIIRNRLKIEAAINNANQFLKVQREFGSFSDYIWRFVGGKPIQNNWKEHGDVPATTLASDALAKDLKQRGFKFIGSTIIYAHMQATGMVNDHTTDCFRHGQLTISR